MRQGNAGAQTLDVRKDGSSFYADITGTRLKYNGEPHILIIVRDISARKRTEEELQRSAKLNELLLDSLPHPALLIRRDRIVLAANRIAKEMGATVGEYCWREFAQCSYIASSVKKQLRQKSPQCSTEGIHCFFCRADDAFNIGTPQNNPELHAFGRIWDTWWIPIHDDTYLHYALDVTERKQTEKSLQESEQRFRKVISRNADAIIIVDQDSRIRFANPSAEHLFGRSRQDLLGSTFGIPISPVEQSAEIEVPTSDGDLLIAEMRRVEIEWENERAYLASLRDISERKKNGSTSSAGERTRGISQQGQESVSGEYEP